MVTLPIAVLLASILSIGLGMAFYAGAINKWYPKSAVVIFLIATLLVDSAFVLYLFTAATVFTSPSRTMKMKEGRA